MAWNTEIGNTPYILHGVKPVGDPVAEVPGEEHGRGDPHGPGVDIVHYCLLPLAQSNLTSWPLKYLIKI